MQQRKNNGQPERENCDHLYMTQQVVSEWRIEGKS